MTPGYWLTVAVVAIVVMAITAREPSKPDN